MRLAGEHGEVPGRPADQSTPPAPETYRLPWEADALYFAVSEPFTSRGSQAGLVFGKLTAQQPLVVRSYMPKGGVIFSDGIEAE